MKLNRWIAVVFFIMAFLAGRAPGVVQNVPEDVTDIAAEAQARVAADNAHDERISAVMTVITPNDTNTVPVFLIMGQSNTGTTEGTGVAPNYVKTNTSVKLWGMAFGGGSFIFPTNQLVDVGMYSKEFWGAELSLSYAYGTGVVFKIMKGSTGLDEEWAPGGEQYGWFTNSWAMLKTALAAEGKTPRIMGLHWAQGEEDANSTNNAALYQTRLFSFMTNACAVLGVSSNDLPITILPLWKDLGRVGRDTILQAQSNFVASWPKARLIAVDDLTDKGDDVHLDGASQIKVGYRILQECNEMNGAAHGKELGASEAISAPVVAAKDRIIYKEKRIEDSFIGAAYPPASSFGVIYYNRFDRTNYTDKYSGIVPTMAGTGTVAVSYAGVTRGGVATFAEPAQIVLTNGAAFSPGTNSFWIVFNADGAASGTDYIIGTDGATTQNPRILCYLKGNELRVSLYAMSASATTNRAHYTFSTDTTTENVWIINGDRSNGLNVYRNGTRLVNTNILSDITFGTVNIGITNNVIIGGHDSSFSGVVDDFIWGVGRALTGAEITNITERIIAGIPPLQD